MDGRFFLFKNQRFDSIFGQTYKGNYNYQHPAIIGRPVMQSARHSGCLPVLFDVRNKQYQRYIFNMKSLTIMGNTISVGFSFYCILCNVGTSIDYIAI